MWGESVLNKVPFATFLLKRVAVVSSAGSIPMIWAPPRTCARGLGIRRIHNPVLVIDTPENRGMINKISYMLKVEEA